MLAFKSEIVQAVYYYLTVFGVANSVSDFKDWEIDMGNKYDS